MSRDKEIKKSKRRFVLLLAGLLSLAATAAFAMSAKPQTYSWHYKMTVTVETPEGLKTGSAVRAMSNAVPRIDLPDVGNPADVSGEAVVVDLGERGVLFALIPHQSDHEFYNAFPTRGPSTLAGIKHYASLPVGTKGTIDPERFPGYPRLVTFTDLKNPKSVKLVYERKLYAGNAGRDKTKIDNFEELFGSGVKLKDITLEITDEPVTRGVVENYLPENFSKEITDRWRELPMAERGRLVNLITFKRGDER
ncbi:MAG: hypothetical protein N0E48_13300 [Candidatus Thiodiazotropha endolucinida]|nr:hypothetical protein [Candidatus Thiodiazotropha taylori]MCW4344307.1 hypothetical protein [Candidatus Thiodiazotropha endolucinida]